MTADDAIAIAREFLRRTGAHAGDEVRVVDLDEQLVSTERRAGKRVPDRLRDRLAGRFAVWFTIPTPPDVSLDPGEIGVQVTKANGAAEQIWSL